MSDLNKQLSSSLVVELPNAKKFGRGGGKAGKGTSSSRPSSINIPAISEKSSIKDEIIKIDMDYIKPARKKSISWGPTRTNKVPMRLPTMDNLRQQRKQRKTGLPSVKNTTADKHFSTSKVPGRVFTFSNLTLNGEEADRRPGFWSRLKKRASSVLSIESGSSSFRRRATRSSAASMPPSMYIDAVYDLISTRVVSQLRKKLETGKSALEVFLDHSQSGRVRCSRHAISQRYKNDAHPEYANMLEDEFHRVMVAMNFLPMLSHLGVFVTLLALTLSLIVLWTPNTDIDAPSVVALSLVYMCGK